LLGEAGSSSRAPDLLGLVTVWRLLAAGTNACNCEIGNSIVFMEGRVEEYKGKKEKKRKRKKKKEVELEKQ
jgi:hypothetical protein